MEVRPQLDVQDEELFNSAMMADEPEIDTPADEPEEQSQEQLRDEAGRFAARQAEPEPQAVVPPVQQDQQQERVPEFRREFVKGLVKEALDANNAEWQRRFDGLARQNQPKAEPAPRPDMYENPEGFVDHGVRQQVDPIRSEISQLREFYSQREAVREHGQEKVQAAYEAISQGMQSRDPEVASVYQRAMSSMDPYGEIVKWHTQRTVFGQIGGDPQAWFGKTLDERLADPKFAGELLQKIQQSTRSNPQGGNPQVRLPPSLSRTASARSASDDDDNDMSDAALFANATR